MDTPFGVAQRKLCLPVFDSGPSLGLRRVFSGFYPVFPVSSVVESSGHHAGQMTFDPVSPTCYKHPFCAGILGKELCSIGMPFSGQIFPGRPDANSERGQAATVLQVLRWKRARKSVKNAEGIAAEGGSCK